MFCPVCQAEYEAAITRCPDDDAELVAQLPAEITPDLSDASFVAFHHFGTPAEAEMVDDMLRQNGLRSAVQGGSADAFAPLLGVMKHGVTVLIDERDVDRAQELYSSIFGNDITPLSGGVAGEDGSDEEDDDQEEAE